MNFSSCGFKWVFVSRFHCSILLATGRRGIVGPVALQNSIPLRIRTAVGRGLGSMHPTLTLLPDSIYGHVVFNVTVTCYISILLLQSQTKLESFLSLPGNCTKGADRIFPFSGCPGDFGTISRISSVKICFGSPCSREGNAQWLSWLRYYATSRKVAGSIPNGIVRVFHWHNPSGRTMALGSNQPLREMNTKNISCGIKAAGVWSWEVCHLHVPFILKYGSLNLLGPSGPVQARTTIDLPLFTYSPEALYWNVYFIWLHLMYSRWLQLYLLFLYSIDAHDCCHSQDKTWFRTAKGRTAYFRSDGL